MRITLISYAVRWYFVLLAAVYTLILIYGAGFAARQGIVLALIFTALAHGLSGRASKPTQKFRPYRVRIIPEFYEVLNDFHLISSPEEWRTIQNGIKASPPPFGSIWGSGITYTVISESDDRERTLIYYDNHKYFVSELRFTEDLAPVHVERPTKVAGLPDHQYVSLFLHPGQGTGGYDLGIRVPESWWKVVAPSCPKPLGIDHDYACGYVNLILATIPYREFDLYWEPAEWKYDYHTKGVKEIEARRESSRKQLGWATQEHPDIPELRIDWPDTIKNQYFLVEHQAI